MTTQNAKQTGPRVLAAPATNPENKPYFDAAAEGRLLVGKCGSCDEHHFYPRKLCPHCFADDVRWIDAAGQGTIYSYSVTRRGAPQPYAIAYVQLTEGVAMLTNIVDCDLDAIRIGQPVRVVFKPTDDGTVVPAFTPI
jgi:hypothetical protein